MAAYDGDFKIFQDLIKEGVHLEDKTVVGETPLDLAIKKRHWNIIELFLNNGTKADLEVVRLLLEAPDKTGSSALFWACQEGHLEIVRLLLEASADVDIKHSEDKITPLIIAAYCGHLQIVELLVSKGADIRAESVPGNVLDAAEAGGHQDIVKFLKPLM